MRKLAQLNKNNLASLRKAFDNAISEVCEDFGIEAHCGNCSYDEYEATYKLHCRIKVAPDKSLVIAKERAKLLEIPEEAFSEHKKLFINGKHRMCIISGYNVRGRKSP